MASPIRMTSTVRSVLDVLQAAAREQAPTYGLLVCQQTGLGSGTVYPILRRLERVGWIRAYWEEDEPGATGPRRRMYELTGQGHAGIAEVPQPRRLPRLEWTT